MKLVKKALAAAAIAAAATSSFGALNNIEGVIWDPSYGFDFNATSASITQNINGSGTLSGFGYVNVINNTSANVFCPGCELTFTFNNFMATGPLGSTNNYTGGTISIFVDNAPDTGAGTSTNVANYSDGAVWLTLAGHANSFGYTFTGNIAATGLNGNGQFDVTGGLAAIAFDTNAMNSIPLAALLGLPTFFGADMTVSTTFTNLDNFPVSATGAGTFTGDTIAVPEPGSLALLGLGLVGLAAARRRKAA